MLPYQNLKRYLKDNVIFKVFLFFICLKIYFFSQIGFSYTLEQISDPAFVRANFDEIFAAYVRDLNLPQWSASEASVEKHLSQIKNVEVARAFWEVGLERLSGPEDLRNLRRLFTPMADQSQEILDYFMDHPFKTAENAYVSASWFGDRISSRHISELIDEARQASPRVASIWQLLYNITSGNSDIRNPHINPSHARAIGQAASTYINQGLPSGVDNRAFSHVIICLIQAADQVDDIVAKYKVGDLFSSSRMSEEQRLEVIANIRRLASDGWDPKKKTYQTI